MKGGTMNDIQTVIENLRKQGWTLQAIADELGVRIGAVQRWRSGENYPVMDKLVRDRMNEMMRRQTSEV